MRRGPSALNALIAVNKPLGMTSHDVVSRVRRAVGEKRVGHAGTLDPDASGVLVLGIGQATKLLGLLTLDRKGYRADFKLGAETTTDDAAGEVTATAEVHADLFETARAEAEVAALVGECDQVPPAYSAVSVGGKRAYALARAGQEVELAARRVTVYGAALESVQPDARVWSVDLDVSKGTYVRSIARDLGRRLGCLAHVCRLERTFAGPVTLDDCVGLDELMERGADLVRERCLDPAAVLGLARRALALDEIQDVVCGRRIAAGTVADACSPARAPRSGERVALTFAGGLAGIWRREGGYLVCESNFPQAIEGVWELPALDALGPATPLARPDALRLVRGAAEPGGRRAPLCRSLDLELAGGVAQVGVTMRPSLDARAFGPGRAAGTDPFVCVVGAFDGMHLGHRALLARGRAEARARGARLALVTFSPDPSLVLGGGTDRPDLLFFAHHPLGLMDFGPDTLVTVRFTQELARLGYQAFVEDVLQATLDVAALVVGADFNLGAGGAGTVAALSELGRARGFDVVGVDLLEKDGAPVTSTRIRGCLRAGKVEEAAGLLGRAYEVVGSVEHGRGEGTGLGFPTANVVVAPWQCLPAEGVYAGYVCVPSFDAAAPDGRGNVLTAWPAAINVGKPPTFSPGEEGAAFLEAMLLGFEGDLYGSDVRVVFVRRLRAAQRFGSVDELKAAVLDNIGWVRSTLGEGPLEVWRRP